jgi:protein-L-isoaspartate(D-aspartate) O-methyltransferase
MNPNLAARVGALIDQIQSETRMTQDMTGLGAISPEVIDALRETPREAYVSPGMESFAYYNQPLPIGCGQTISQPFIVALMSELLRPKAGDTVLEVGCGSGYQAAVLAQLVGRVVSVEIRRTLAEAATRTLRSQGVGNVEVFCADGWHGWPPAAPYDGIIVTACARHVPPALIEQLSPGGRLVLPLGEPHGSQDLVVIDKGPDGTTRSKRVLAVAFVPLTRDED